MNKGLFLSTAVLVAITHVQAMTEFGTWYETNSMDPIHG